MERALKAFGITNTVLWVLLIGFTAFAIYFVAVGAVFIYIDRPFLLEYKEIAKYVVYIYVKNNGMLSINKLYLKATLSNRVGLICENSTRLGDVEPGTELIFPFVLYLPPKVPKSEEPMNLMVVADMLYAYMFPVTINVTFEVKTPGN